MTNQSAKTQILLTLFIFLLFQSCQSRKQENASRIIPAKNKIPEEFQKSPLEARKDPDFSFQGDYIGWDTKTKGKEKLAAQNIALGEGHFQTVLFKKGFPGEGWDGINKSLVSGNLNDGRVSMIESTGNREYSAENSESFSASLQFPPTGQAQYIGHIEKDKMHISVDGKKSVLTRIFRKSPTLGKKTPKTAVILFDQNGTDNWKGAKYDQHDQVILVAKKKMETVQKFDSYRLHLEFMLSFSPSKRGQKKSGGQVSLSDNIKIKLLDSYGLEGLRDECGSINSLFAPSVNACFPPCSWQTLDLELKKSTGAENESSAFLTVQLNGTEIHKNLSLNKPKSPIVLEGNENEIQFRNIWIEKI